MSAALAIVIVNYRTPELAIACLRSLAPELGTIPDGRVVVVDNHAGDDSPERISAAISEAGWEAWVSLMVLPDNRGFSAGNNAAIRRLLSSDAPPRWILLLNPDTVVQRGALRALLGRAEQRPRAGVVGSRLENPDGTPQPAAFRFHTVLTEIDDGLRLGPVSRLLSRWALVLPEPRQACRADWVCGASMLVRREVFEEVGLLDEGYFLYFEEVDLCLRAARAGWECWHEPRSRVVHLERRSTGVDPGARLRRLPPYVLESRRRYFVKNHGVAYAALADVAWIVGHLAWRARMVLQRRADRAQPGLLRDFLRHSVLVRGGVK